MALEGYYTTTEAAGLLGRRAQPGADGGACPRRPGGRGELGATRWATSCAGERSCDPGARREASPSPRRAGVCRRSERGSDLSGGSSQGSPLCHTGARAGAGGGCCLLHEGPSNADGRRRMRGHLMPA